MLLKDRKTLVTGVKAFVSLARLPNAVLPAIAVVAGAAAVGGLNAGSLVLRIALVVLVHSVVTVWNDIADEAGDAHNGIHRLEKIRKVGAYEWLLGLTYAAAALSLVLSLWLPWDLQLLVLVSLGLGWIYNAPPLQASRRPVASIVVLAGAYGLVPFLLGSGFIALGGRIWILAISWTVIRTSLSLLKDYKDAPGDAKADKKTFLLVYGNKRTVRLSLVLAALGYGGCVVAVAMGSRYVLAAAATLGLTAAWLMHERSRLKRAKGYAELNTLFHQFLQYELLFDCLAVLWLHIH